MRAKIIIRVCDKLWRLIARRSLVSTYVHVCRSACIDVDVHISCTFVCFLWNRISRSNMDRKLISRYFLHGLGCLFLMYRVSCIQLMLRSRGKTYGCDNCHNVCAHSCTFPRANWTVCVRVKLSSINREKVDRSKLMSGCMTRNTRLFFNLIQVTNVRNEIERDIPRA